MASIRCCTVLHSLLLVVQELEGNNHPVHRRFLSLPLSLSWVPHLRSHFASRLTAEWWCGNLNYGKDDQDLAVCREGVVNVILGCTWHSWVPGPRVVMNSDCYCPVVWHLERETRMKCTVLPDVFFFCVRWYLSIGEFLSLHKMLGGCGQPIVCVGKQPDGHVLDILWIQPQIWDWFLIVYCIQNTAKIRILSLGCFWKVFFIGILFAAADSKQLPWCILLVASV
jgi:hypothetical protein